MADKWAQYAETPAAPPPGGKWAKYAETPAAAAEGTVLGGAWDAAKGLVTGGAKLGYHTLQSLLGDDSALRKDAEDAVNAQADQWQKAKDALKRGDHTEAAGHVGAAMLPIIGPAAAHAGERIGGELKYDEQGHPTGVVKAPDVKGGIGEGLVIAGAPLVGEAVRRTAPAVARGTAATVDAVKSGAGKVADIALHPATREVLGVVSPRLKHVLDVATRGKRAFDAFKAESGEAAAAPAAAAAAPAVDPMLDGLARSQTTSARNPQGIAFAELPEEMQAQVQSIADRLNGAQQPPQQAAAPRAPEPEAAAVDQAPPDNRSIAQMIRDEVAAKNGKQPEAPLAARVPGAQQPLTRPAGVNVPLRPPVQPGTAAPPAAPLPETPGLSKASSIAQQLKDEMEASGTIEAEPKPRSLAQNEADMMRKKPAQVEASQTQYDANGELKSPQMRLQEKIAGHRTNKATKLADALTSDGATLEKATNEMTGRDWKALGKRLGFAGVPSADTIAETLGMMKQAEKAAAATKPARTAVSFRTKP